MGRVDAPRARVAAVAGLQQLGSAPARFGSGFPAWSRSDSGILRLPYLACELVKVVMCLVEVCGVWVLLGG